MKTLFLSVVLCLFFPGLMPGLALIEFYEFGDAPDGAIAYPSTGIIGNFPTCSSNGIFIRHGWGDVPTLFFGPSADIEFDGNAGACPSFPPYDQDECMNDGDAGLLIPTAFTIDSVLNVVPCPAAPLPATALGTTCALAVWGVNVDIHLTEQWGGEAYINVLMDWNQDGVWSGGSVCPDGPAPEHVLVNFMVTGPYSGPLSLLSPPAFRIGPNSGYVWTRFTISYEPVAFPWDGSGIFEEGETEDYLLWIFSDQEPPMEGDYGDAPEGALAYPDLGVIGQFPTCKTIGPPGWYVEHQFSAMFFGPSADAETDGNAGLCPGFANQYDMDECFNDGDAGLILPEAFTIVGPSGAEYVQPCTGAVGTSLGQACTMANWGTDIDIHVDNSSGPPSYVNVLADWNQDGMWFGGIDCPGFGYAPEHILFDFAVPPGFIGPLSALSPPPFLIGPNDGYVWFRFTISEVIVGPDEWDGSGQFEQGETEDYLLQIDLSADPTPTPVPTDTPTAAPTATPTHAPTHTPTAAPTSTPTPTPTPQCLNHGDVNFDGVLTAADAQLTFMIAIGSYLPSYLEACAADCNGDGNVTAGDAQMIFMAAIGVGSCVDAIP